MTLVCLARASRDVIADWARSTVKKAAKFDVNVESISTTKIQKPKTTTRADRDWIKVKKFLKFVKSEHFAYTHPWCLSSSLGSEGSCGKPNALFVRKDSGSLYFYP